MISLHTQERDHIRKTKQNYYINAYLEIIILKTRFESNQIHAPTKQQRILTRSYKV